MRHHRSLAPNSGAARPAMYSGQTDGDCTEGPLDGATPLFVASLNGHKACVETLLGSGADVHRTTNDRWTPLLASVRNGHHDVTAMLVNAGAKLEHTDKHEHTPLFIATENGHDKCVQVLVQAGADVNRAMPDGRTSLFAASQLGHAHCLERLLSAPNALLNTPMADGRTCLTIAAQNGFDSCVCILIAHGADVHQTLSDGRTALFLAAQGGHDKVLQELIIGGANSDTAKSDGLSALHVAAQFGHADCVRTLLASGAPVNRCTNTGVTPLLLASMDGHESCVKALLAAGADTGICNKNGYSPLVVAARMGQEDCIRTLIAHGADVNDHRNEQRTSPLFVAAQNGKLGCVQALLEGGAIVDLADRDKITPLFVAVANGHTACVHMLIRSHATIDTLCSDINMTPLCKAAEIGQNACGQALIDAGANIHHRRTDGWTPLHIAASNGHGDFIRLLADAGADLMTLTKDDKTALSVASENGRKSCVAILRQLMEARMKHPNVCCNQDGILWHVIRAKDVNALLSKGATVTVSTPLSDGTNRSVLHLAVQTNQTPLVQALLTIGADVNARTNRHETPLHYAAFQGNEAAVNILLKHGADPAICDVDGYTFSDHLAIAKKSACGETRTAATQTLVMATPEAQSAHLDSLLDQVARDTLDRTKATTAHLKTWNGSLHSALMLMTSQGAGKPNLSRPLVEMIEYRTALALMDAIAERLNDWLDYKRETIHCQDSFLADSALRPYFDALHDTLEAAYIGASSLQTDALHSINPSTLAWAINVVVNLTSTLHGAGLSAGILQAVVDFFGVDRQHGVTGRLLFIQDAKAMHMFLEKLSNILTLARMHTLQELPSDDVNQGTEQDENAHLFRNLWRKLLFAPSHRPHQRMGVLDAERILQFIFTGGLRDEMQPDQITSTIVHALGLDSLETRKHAEAAQSVTMRKIKVTYKAANGLTMAGFVFDVDVRELTYAKLRVLVEADPAAVILFKTLDHFVVPSNDGGDPERVLHEDSFVPFEHNEVFCS